MQTITTKLSVGTRVRVPIHFISDGTLACTMCGMVGRNDGDLCCVALSHCEEPDGKRATVRGYSWYEWDRVQVEGGAA